MLRLHHSSSWCKGSGSSPLAMFRDGTNLRPHRHLSGTEGDRVSPGKGVGKRRKRHVNFTWKEGLCRSERFSGLCVCSEQLLWRVEFDGSTDVASGCTPPAPSSDLCWLHLALPRCCQEPGKASSGTVRAPPAPSTFWKHSHVGSRDVTKARQETGWWFPKKPDVFTCLTAPQCYSAG